MKAKDKARLRELESLEYDGAKLSAEEYAELNALLVQENAEWIDSCKKFQKWEAAA